MPAPHPPVDGTPLDGISDEKSELPDELLDPHYRDALLSGSPVNSYFWWGFKHPITRLFTSVLVMFLNLYVWLGDPASYSNAKSYGTFVGDIYHGFLEPDDIGWFLLRWIIMILFGLLGNWLGIGLHRLLRDYFRLVLFGYNNGRNPKRDPLAHQDGAFFCCACLISGMWFIGLKLYALVLTKAQVHPNHIPNSGMHNWTYAGMVAAQINKSIISIQVSNFLVYKNVLKYDFFSRL